MKKVQFVFILTLFVQFSFAQTYSPGQTYFDSTGFVEYRAGNLPIILSAPHGGSLEPDTIPDRNCAGCVIIKDAWTKPITEGVYDAIVTKTGCYPHTIINLLHRIKFDANRQIGDAADGNATVEKSWQGYHRFIDSSKAKITEDYGRGLILDMHGHGHAIQRIELGYLLNASELRNGGSLLNSESLIKESSIRTLVSDNIMNHSHSDLLQGEHSFGTLLDTKGFAAVPSSSDSFPKINEAYFDGGYITQRHGSRNNSDPIDGIQIEMNQAIRFNDSTRAVLIDSLAESIIDYMHLHYFSTFKNKYCGLINSVPKSLAQQKSYHLYPNPTKSSFSIHSSVGMINRSYQLCNLQGKRLKSGTIINKQVFHIDLSDLQSGMYLLRIGNTFYKVRRE